MYKDAGISIDNISESTVLPVPDVYICGKGIVDAFGDGKSVSNVTFGRSFACSTISSPTGYTAKAMRSAPVPTSHIKDSFMSWACAQTFRVGGEDGGSIDVADAQTFLTREFGPHAVGDRCQMTRAAVTGIASLSDRQAAGVRTEKEVETMRDALPWVETLGINGNAGFYQSLADPSVWLAFAFVSETPATANFADEHRSKGVVALLDEFVALPEYAKLRMANRRAARRILARMLARVRARGVAFAPDVLAARPAPALDPEDFGELEYKMYALREQPHLVVPQYEQEMDAFVWDGPASNPTSTITYCCGMSPADSCIGGIAAACGGESNRWSKLIVRDLSALKVLEAPSQFALRRERRFYDTWMHPGVGSPDYTIAFDGKNAIHPINVAGVHSYTAVATVRG
jgi:hypothetical protein